MLKLEKTEEEFTNFMHKVNQVNKIIKKLNSNDKEEQLIGDLEAQQYLGDDKEKILENIDEENVDLKVQCNRTVLNRKCLEEKPKDQNTMTQEAFMAEVERDADQRYKNKLIRTERMETFKKRATLAFRRGEYEKALSLYTQAIDQIKDSCLLYNNRALTYIKLKFYDKAIDDLGWAIRVNENSLKAHLLLAKAHYLNKNFEKFRKTIDEIKGKRPEDEEFINDFVNEIVNTNNSKSDC